MIGAVGALLVDHHLGLPGHVAGVRRGLLGDTPEERDPSDERDDGKAAG